jgi:hypothetical protein
MFRISDCEQAECAWAADAGALVPLLRPGPLLLLRSRQTQGRFCLPDQSCEAGSWFDWVIGSGSWSRKASGSPPPTLPPPFFLFLCYEEVDILLEVWVSGSGIPGLGSRIFGSRIQQHKKRREKNINFKKLNIISFFEQVQKRFEQNRWTGTDGFDSALLLNIIINFTKNFRHKYEKVP